MTGNVQDALNGAERARKDLEAAGSGQEMPGGAQAGKNGYSGACCQALLAEIADALDAKAGLYPLEMYDPACECKDCLAGTMGRHAYRNAAALVRERQRG